MVFVTVILFIALLLVLVLVHEWGHFIVAKKLGCGVEEFGFGFPPRLWSFMKGGTRYSVNLLPIGGFVKIEGENMEAGAVPSRTSFASKPAWARIAILVAGVVMNVVLAFVLLTVQAGIGVPTVVTDANATTLSNFYTYIVDVTPHSPAADAGIKAFDRLVKVNATENPSISGLQTVAKQEAGKPITIEVDRAGQDMSFTVTPRVNPPAGEGALGVSLATTGLTKVPWWQAPWAGAQRTWELLVTIVGQFGQILVGLFHNKGVGDSLSSPIGIAIYTSAAAHMGWSYFLEFAAIISLNLAIINILPLPALDGGRVLFVLLERVVPRKRLSQVENYVHTAGFVLLIVIMILVTLKDIHRYF